MAPLEVFANDATTTVTSGGTSAPTAGTVESWTVTSSASFPSLTAGTQFHVADPGHPTELVAVTAVSGTSWTVTRGAESTTPVAHTAGFTAAQVVTAGTLRTFQYQPYQFVPESYGAKGDGKIIGDATIAGGSLTTLTSASAGFTSADTGKTIMVNGAKGNNAAPLVSLITFVNSTTVTLTTTATSAVTNASAIYGTDDTTAINSAVTAAGTFAVGAFGNYHAQVLFGDKFYMLTSGPTQTGNGSSTPTFNAQIPLPYHDATGASQKLCIDLIGVGPADDAMYFESAIPNIQGSCLVSTLLGPGTPDATFGAQSVVGGPSKAAGFTGSYANTKCYADGMTVVIPYGGNAICWDWRNLASAGSGRISARAFAAPNGNYSNLTTTNVTAAPIGSAISTGLWPPLVNNNDDCTFMSLQFEGVNVGIQLTEHLAIPRLSTILCTAGAQMSSAGNVHGNWIGYWTAESGFAALQNASGSNTSVISIGMLDAGQQEGFTWSIQDASSGFQGWVNLVVNGSSAPLISGAQKLHITCVNPGDEAGVPGVWGGAPGAPSTGVAQTNLSGWNATVYVTSTAAITALAVDGTSIFSGSLASGALVPVRVPYNHTYTVTSAGGTLTTKWVLD